MLRAKQISNLSGGARSFFLSGTRCNAPDGGTCTCSEDETCLSRRPQGKNGNLLAQNESTLVSKTTPKVGGTVASGGSVNRQDLHKAESVHQSGCVQEIVANPSPSKKLDSVTYASGIDSVQYNAAYSSSLNADQFFRAGIAAVNFLSDLVNYKLPLSGGGKILNYSQNCMVDPTRPITNVRSSNVKHIRRENFSSVHPKPPPTDGGSNLQVFIMEQGEKVISQIWLKG